MVFAGFLVFLVAMLAIDLRLASRKSHIISVREAAAWVGVWVGLALAFGVLLLRWQGPQVAVEYFTAYLIEYSLSVDNMFVFIVIFSYFSVPAKYQHKVLFLGILGAIISRGIFIAVGAGLLARFDWIIYVFGALLLITAVRLLRAHESVDPERNLVLRFFNKHFRTTTEYEGQKLFSRRSGRRVATPMLVVLLVIETTDIAFAIDSIPAVFAITKIPFIVLTSNLFAVLGLRALYFLIAGTMARFHLLRFGLSAILAFVGVKMLLSDRIHIGTGLSLGVIAGVLAMTMVASLLIPQRDQHSESGGGDEPR